MTGRGEHLLERDRAGEFQVGDGDGTPGVRSSDQVLLHRGGESRAPDNRSRVRAQDVKSHSTHAGATGVAGSRVRGGDWYQLAKSSWPCGQRVREGAEVGDGVEDVPI